MTLDRPFAGLRIGLQPPDDPTMLERAVDAARVADAAVVVVGTNDEWETEGSDRADITLPGRQDELVAKVAAVNPRTIVVVNAGAPVAMPWLDDVAAVLLPFFGGQEAAPALVDVLTGAVDPGGRLPISFPKRLEDAPAMAHYQPVDRRQTYGEGFGVGYRGHDRSGVPPLFPFGHGLSYGDATWGEPEVTATHVPADGQITVTVPVRATGPRDATVVVQGYVAPVAPPVDREPKALRAWAKAVVPAGTTRRVTLRFGPHAFRRWDDGLAGWTVDLGRYDLLLAASATDVRHVVPVTVV
jgi:beta-glucosidase